MSRVSRKASLDSSIYLIQLQTFVMIEKWLLFTSREMFLSGFPSEGMDLDELPFEVGVPVLGVGPS